MACAAACRDDPPRSSDTSNPINRKKRVWHLSCMADIAVTVQESGAAYVTLVVGEPPEVRDSVALGEHEAADQIPALDGIVLDFDHYGRLVGLRVTDSADSILAPSLIEAAQSSA